MGSSNRKIKVFILGTDNINWSIDKDREATVYFLKENNFEITNNFLKANVIFCVWYDLLLNPRYFWIKWIKRFLNKKIIAVITNDVTFYPQKIEILREYVNVFIAPSEKIYKYLKENGIKVYKIPFFVDHRIFKPFLISKEQVCKKLNIDWGLIKDKFLIGSFQRDSLGSDLTKPKWQKNPDLLIKILNKLPKDRFVLILTGPRRHYIINQCEKVGIPYLFYGDKKYITELKDDLIVNNMDTEKIALLYNLIDLYIIPSKSEGGPKAILESSLTKTLIVSTAVGLAPDILHPDLIYEEEDYKKIVNFTKDIMEKKINVEKYIDYNYQRVTDVLDEKKLLEKYAILIKNI